MFNYLSGEQISGVDMGSPMVIRSSESIFNLANFCRMFFYSAFATLKLGMEILVNEKVQIDRITGHGGLFRYSDVGQRFLSATINAPVYFMDNAASGGPWGAAILGLYLINHNPDESMEDFLAQRVFLHSETHKIKAEVSDVESYDIFFQKYIACLGLARLAYKVLNLEMKLC